MKTIYTVFLLLLLLSCTSSSEKLAWEIANNSQTNKKELTRFLEHYKTNKDKDKYKAACFLIENMPNKYRSTGTGLVMSVSRLLIGVVTPVVPIIMAMNGISPMFNVSAINSLFYIIPAIICLLWGSKTAQRSLEEIEAEATSR